MRISGGKARGIGLRAPKGEGVRPATDQMREAVFSSLGGSVVGARVLDLYAGTGSYGLEALSRGAREAVFVEKDREALRCLEANLEAVEKAIRAARGEGDQKSGGGAGTGGGWVLAGEVGKRPLEGRFELIFADPPWADWARVEAEVWRVGERHLAPEGCMVLEMPGGWAPSPPAGWEIQKVLGKERKDQPRVMVVGRGEGCRV